MSEVFSFLPPNQHIVTAEFFLSKDIKRVAFLAEQAGIRPVACYRKGGFTNRFPKDKTDPGTPSVQFNDDDVILAFGLAAIDIDAKPDRGGLSLKESLTALAELMPAGATFKGEIAYSINGGAHLIGKPVERWLSKNNVAPEPLTIDLRSGCAPWPYGIGISPSIRDAKDGLSRSYEWSRAQKDPIAKFLDATGFESMDEVPEFYCPALLRDAAWVALDDKPSVEIGSFHPLTIDTVANWLPPEEVAKLNAKTRGKSKGKRKADEEEEEEVEPATKETVFAFLDDLVSFYQENPDAETNYLTDESMWSGLMANIKFCGKEVGAEDEIKEYWLGTFCKAAAKIYGHPYDDADNEKRYDAKRAVENDGKHINGVASLRAILQGLNGEVHQKRIKEGIQEIRNAGEVYLLARNNGGYLAYCVPFGQTWPLEAGCEVLMGASSGIAYSDHLKRPNFNPFAKLRKAVASKIGKPLSSEPVSNYMLTIIKGEFQARTAIDLALIGVLGDKYEGAQKLKPITRMQSAHLATSDIRDFLPDHPTPVRDDRKALEFCKSIVLAWGVDTPSVGFGFRVFAHKVRWPSAHISLIISIMSMTTIGPDGKPILKGGTGKEFTIKYFSDNYLAGRHNFNYNPNSRFNGHQAQTLILVWDEHPDPNDRIARNRAEFANGIENMKRESADETREIEFKGENVATTRNGVLRIMLTNAATGTGTQDAERRVLQLQSCSSASMSPADRVALGERLQDAAHRNAILELISVCKPLTESECKFAPRSERAIKAGLESEFNSNPKLTALYTAIGELIKEYREHVGEPKRAEKDCAEVKAKTGHSITPDVPIMSYTMEELAHRVNQVLERNQTTRAYRIMNPSNSGLSNLIARLKTDDDRPFILPLKPAIKADKSKGRLHQAATYTIDEFAYYDSLGEAEDHTKSNDATQPTLSPERLEDEAILLWEFLRGEKWAHGRTHENS